MASKVTVDGMLKDGVLISVKNVLPLLVNIVLWILTVWIPYLNIGTTIGLFTGIIAKMSRDEALSMTEIFNPIYRKRMGEFFLTMGLMFAGIGAGLFLFIAPVLSIAWSQALLLVVDKERDPSKAITESNTLTYGSKLTIFLGFVVLFVLAIILAFLLGKIPAVGAFLAFLVFIGLGFVVTGINAYIYKTLSA